MKILRTNPYTNGPYVFFFLVVRTGIEPVLQE